MELVGYENDPVEVAAEADEQLAQHESDSDHNRVMLETSGLDVELLKAKDSFVPASFRFRTEDIEEAEQLYNQLVSAVDGLGPEDRTVHNASFYRDGDLPDLSLSFTEYEDQTDTLYGEINGRNTLQKMDDLEGLADLQLIEEDFEKIVEEVAPEYEHDITGEADQAIAELKANKYLRKILDTADRWVPGDHSVDPVNHYSRVARALPDYSEDVGDVELVQGLDRLSSDYSQIEVQVNSEDLIYLGIQDDAPNTVAVTPNHSGTFLRNSTTSELEDLWQQTVSEDEEITAQRLENYPDRAPSVTHTEKP